MPSSRTADAWGLIGTVVDGRYRVEEIAGRGGHGVVYRALHLGFDLPVALKVLRLTDPDDDSARDTLLDSFRREGRLLSQLSALHPAFVQAREAGTVLRSDGSPAPYLVLEWLDGAGLDQEVKQRRALETPPLDLAEAIGLLDSAAQGLVVAHSRGISHRDLKPGNLFVVVRDGTAKVKILDFGLAKVMGNTLSTAARFVETRRTRHSFTHAYGAPEQWLSRLGASGPWTDVHAWALICVELVSGKPALLGRDSEQLMGACLDDRRPTLRNAGVTVSDAVEAVFTRALALQPSKRYPDLGAFWQALRTAAGIVETQELAACRLISLTPSTPSPRTPSELETAPPTASMSAGGTAVTRPARKLRAATAALGAAALLCAIAGLLTLQAASPPVAQVQRSTPQGVSGSKLGPEQTHDVTSTVQAPLAPLNRSQPIARERPMLPKPAAHSPPPRASAAVSQVRPGAPLPARLKHSVIEPARSPLAAVPAPAPPFPQPLPSALPGFHRFD